MSLQPSRLSIDIRDDRRVVLSGVLDAHTAPTVDEQAALLGSDDDVELDLASVEFVDSSGLRSIVSWHEQLAGAEHRLIMISPSESVVRLFEISGLREHLHFG